MLKFRQKITVDVDREEKIDWKQKGTLIEVKDTKKDSKRCNRITNTGDTANSLGTMQWRTEFKNNIQEHEGTKVLLT